MNPVPVADVRIYHSNVLERHASENERRDRGRERGIREGESDPRKLTCAHARPPFGVGGCGESMSSQAQRKERTRQALTCFMNDGAPFLTSSPREQDEDENLCTRHGP